MKYLLIIALLITLQGCGLGEAWDEMGDTGEPPVTWTNRYAAGVKIVTHASLVREPWNYVFGIVEAATSGGIDLTVEEPDEGE